MVLIITDCSFNGDYADVITRRVVGGMERCVSVPSAATTRVREDTCGNIIVSGERTEQIRTVSDNSGGVTRRTVASVHNRDSGKMMAAFV